MRIALNAKSVAGAFGGANQFANSLENYLRSCGHSVFRELVPGLDAVLIIAAQPNLQITAFTLEEILEYKRISPRTKVVLRVNTCDAPRGSNRGTDELYLKAAAMADHLIFVSRFMEEYLAEKGLPDSPTRTVIHNGADPDIFNPGHLEVYSGDGPLKLVTHHWSDNYLKGFDVYERLDQMLDDPSLNLSFTIIGNLPYGLKLRNSRVVAPLPGPALAAELKTHHGYLTAARHEPGGNHYVEAMRCGLPILFLNSGSLPEYCGNFGLEFDLADFDDKLLEFRSCYSELRRKLPAYSWDSRKMCAAYEKLLSELVGSEDHEQSPPGIAVRSRYLLHNARRTCNRLRRRLASVIAG